MWGGLLQGWIRIPGGGGFTETEGMTRAATAARWVGEYKGIPTLIVSFFLEGGGVGWRVPGDILGKVLELKGRFLS